jgi:hypothetical protein
LYEIRPLGVEFRSVCFKVGLLVEASHTYHIYCVLASIGADGWVGTADIVSLFFVFIKTLNTIRLCVCEGEIERSNSRCTDLLCTTHTTLLGGAHGTYIQPTHRRNTE